MVAAKGVVVEDLSRDPGAEQPTLAKAVWYPIPARWTEPSFSSAFVSDLRSSLLGFDGSRDLLSVTVLEAGFFREILPVDSVPYINVLAALREHRYACKATISLRQYDRVYRTDIVTRVFPYKAFFGDIEPQERRNLILDCKAELLTAAQDSIDQFLAGAQ